MTATKMNSNAITGEELGKILLSSWRNCNKEATPTEIARKEWQIKKIVYREKRMRRITK